jgi:hypothetical protein
VVSPEHLPDAVKAFGVKKAWRFWSVNDPSLHQATYEFTDQAALDRAMSGDALKTLVAEFGRCWPDVTRARAIFVLAEEFGWGEASLVIPGQPAGLNPESGDYQREIPGSRWRAPRNDEASWRALSPGRRRKLLHTRRS